MNLIKNSDISIVDSATFREFLCTSWWLNETSALSDIMLNAVLSEKAENKVYITSSNTDIKNLKLDNISTLLKKDFDSNIIYNGEEPFLNDCLLFLEIFNKLNETHIIRIFTNTIFQDYPTLDILDITFIKEYFKNTDSSIVQIKDCGVVVIGNSFHECSCAIDYLLKNKAPVYWCLKMSTLGHILLRGVGGPVIYYIIFFSKSQQECHYWI